MGEVTYLDGRGRHLEGIDALRKLVADGRVQALTITAFGVDEETKQLTHYVQNMHLDIPGLSSLIGFAEVTLNLLQQGLLLALHQGTVPADPPEERS